MANSSRGARVLIVDDQSSMAETLADGLMDRGYDAVWTASNSEAAKLVSEGDFDALVTDLRMPGIDGLNLLAMSRRAAPDRPVIVMTAYSAIDTAIESIRHGAFHYLTKPFKVDELALFLNRALDDARLRREAAALKRALRKDFAGTHLIGESETMREVRELIERVSEADVPVLILGETGAGKGLVARAIHAQSRRNAGPFVAVNCAAIPETLLESELFGHVKGAFTGASHRREGLIAEAADGTLFLDEIGEMSLALQAKLLHVLENGAVRPVGANSERKVDVRFVAATHQHLRQRVAAGTFREDLLYRLEVITVELPPLRQRRQDIPILADYFFAQAKTKHPESIARAIGADAMERLLDHDWPGNVRELEHAIERAVLLARKAEISATDLPSSLRPTKIDTPTWSGDVLPMREITKRYAMWAYEQLGEKKGLTAEKLGVDPKTLKKLLEGIGE